MKHLLYGIGLGIVVPLGGLSGTTAQAATPAPGNLVVSVNEFTGSSSAPRYVRDYTISGVRVQTLSLVPTPGGTAASTETARDLVFGPGNALYLYNGTFSPYLARFDFGTSTWTQSTFAGWNTRNNTTYGGLTRLGQYLYAADMAAPSDENGIVRFDTLGGPTVRFATTIHPNDVNLGANGLLYAIDGASSPTSTIYRYDPLSFAALGTIPVLTDGYRAVAALADGSIFAATTGGVIRHYSSTGTLLKSLTVPGEFFSDIDINASGQIALGTGQTGNVVLTDIALDSFTKFRATDSASGGATFVTWAVPEPTSAALLLGGGALLALRRRRSPAGA